MDSAQLQSRAWRARLPFQRKKKTTFCIFPTKKFMINYFRFLYYDRQQTKSHYFDKRSIILC